MNPGFRAGNCLISTSQFLSDYVVASSDPAEKYINLGLLITFFLEGQASPAYPVVQSFSAVSEYFRSGFQATSYVDAIGRLSGIVLFKSSGRDIYIDQLYSLHGAGIAIIASFLRSKIDTYSRISWRSRKHNNSFKTRSLHLFKTEAPSVVNDCWMQDEGRECLTFARETVHQFAMIGFAFFLASMSETLSQMESQMFLKLILNPLLLGQLDIAYDKMSSLSGLTAYAYVQSPHTIESIRSFLPFTDIAEWRSGPHRIPVWSLHQSS
ncbi:MAG: hypothetical protein ACK55D_00905 [Synechococcaceae cyanobacterium]